MKPLILAIDDDPLYLKSIEVMLEDDYQILTAACGETGLSIYKIHVPDIVLCDVKMQDSLNGYHVCDQLKSVDPTVSVVLISNFQDEDSRLIGHRYGADTYLGKNTSPSELKQVIKNILIRNKVLKYESPPVKKLISDKATFVSKLHKVLSQALSNKSKPSQIQIGYVAQELGMSTSTLQRKTKKFLGETFTEFKQNYLLEKALDLLSTNLTIAEISHATGFESPSYFAYLFKLKYGCSPRDYKAQKSKLKKLT